MQDWWVNSNNFLQNIVESNQIWAVKRQFPQLLSGKRAILHIQCLNKYVVTLSKMIFPVYFKGNVEPASGITDFCFPLHMSFWAVTVHILPLLISFYTGTPGLMKFHSFFSISSKTHLALLWCCLLICSLGGSACVEVLLRVLLSQSQSEFRKMGLLMGEIVAVDSCLPFVLALMLLHLPVCSYVRIIIKNHKKTTYSCLEIMILCREIFTGRKINL